METRFCTFVFLYTCTWHAIAIQYYLMRYAFKINEIYDLLLLRSFDLTSYVIRRKPLAVQAVMLVQSWQKGTSFATLMFFFWVGVGDKK